MRSTSCRRRCLGDQSLYPRLLRGLTLCDVARGKLLVESPAPRPETASAIDGVEHIIEELGANTPLIFSESPVIFARPRQAPNESAAYRVAGGCHDDRNRVVAFCAAPIAGDATVTMTSTFNCTELRR